MVLLTDRYTVGIHNATSHTYLKFMCQGWSELNVGVDVSGLLTDSSSACGCSSSSDQLEAIHMSHSVRLVLNWLCCKHQKTASFRI